MYVFRYTYLNREVDRERGGQREVPLIIHVLVVYKSALLWITFTTGIYSTDICLYIIHISCICVTIHVDSLVVSYMELCNFKISLICWKLR